jgi:anti-sigma factor RsiW
VTCREFIDFLMDYLDGALGAGERARFDEHLAECPDCVSYVATYRAAVALGKAVFADPNETVPETVPDELVNAILAARKSAR